jgi:hypothetical protein
MSQTVHENIYREPYRDSRPVHDKHISSVITVRTIMNMCRSASQV